jgi:hypothetical protein
LAGFIKSSGKADAKKVDILLDEVTQLANMIASGILKLKGKI